MDLGKKGDLSPPDIFVEGGWVALRFSDNSLVSPQKVDSLLLSAYALC